MSFTEFEKNMAFHLTPEEAKELKAHPAPAEITSREQFALRQKIGQKQCAFFNQSKTVPNEARKLYEKFPMWRFYTVTDEKDQPVVVMRVYGAIYDGQEPGMQVMSLRGKPNNKAAIRVKAEFLKAVDEWTDAQKRFIRAHSDATVVNAFLDPLGYGHFLYPAKT